MQCPLSAVCTVYSPYTNLCSVLCLECVLCTVPIPIFTLSFVCSVYCVQSLYQSSRCPVSAVCTVYSPYTNLHAVLCLQCVLCTVPIPIFKLSFVCSVYCVQSSHQPYPQCVNCTCTVGLKKVTNEMKTHKNPELRASSVVKAGDLPAKKQTKPVTTAPAVKKNPVFGLQGKKWIVVSFHLISAAALFIVE